MNSLIKKKNTQLLLKKDVIAYYTQKLHNFCIYTYNIRARACVYIVAGNFRDNVCVQVKRTKLSRKILYHLAVFAIINEKLIIKDRRMCRM